MSAILLQLDIMPCLLQFGTLHMIVWFHIASSYETWTRWFFTHLDPRWPGNESRLQLCHCRWFKHYSVGRSKHSATCLQVVELFMTLMVERYFVWWTQEEKWALSSLWISFVCNILRQHGMYPLGWGTNNKQVIVYPEYQTMTSLAQDIIFQYVY